MLCSGFHSRPCTRIRCALGSGSFPDRGSVVRSAGLTPHPLPTLPWAFRAKCRAPLPTLPERRRAAGFGGSPCCFLTSMFPSNSRREAAAYGVASSAPIINRSILFEVKSCAYMFYAGFQKGPIEFRACPLDVDTLEGVSCPTLPYPGGSWPGQAHPYLPYPQA